MPMAGTFPGDNALQSRNGIGATLISLESAVYIPMALLLVLLICRILLRRTWAAEGVSVLLFAAALMWVAFVRKGDSPLYSTFLIKQRARNLLAALSITR